MEFTGERLVLGQSDIELEIEHINRYKFALQFVEGMRVLDAACGTGYGSAILAQRAAAVTGIDISEEAIEYANSKYGNDTIDFKVASIDQLPFDDHCFDVVVSFETLEHVDETTQHNFLKEITRVIKPEGILIISTPNHDIYKKRGMNPYHVHELSLSEFNILLKNRFNNVSILSQQFEVCNVIVGQQEELSDNVNGIRLETAEYLIAVCSNVQLPRIKNRVYVRKDNKFNDLMSWAISTHELNEEKNQHINEQNLKISQLEALNKELNNNILKYLERIDQLLKKINYLETEHKEDLSKWDSEYRALHNELVKSNERIAELEQTVLNKEGHINYNDTRN